MLLLRCQIVTIERKGKYSGYLYSVNKNKMTDLIPVESITGKIFMIRGHKVMLDRDLSELYGVETKRLKEQVRRNILRFPEDFMFVLTNQEVRNLRSQIASSSWGGTRHPPMAFTEQGGFKGNGKGKI